MQQQTGKRVFGILLVGICFWGCLPFSGQAQSFDLSDILNGNVSGTYERIEVNSVANTAQLVFENITIAVDASSGQSKVTSITLESGTFTYAGLAASITDASYDPSTRVFIATASVAFPVDLTVAAQFSISESGVTILGGRINLPDFEVGNVGVKNAYVEYYPQQDKLGGGAAMTVPGLGADPKNPATISGSLEIVHGQLTMFAITADGLKIPLGNTSAYLNTIGVKGENINNFSQFKLTGSLGIVGGPEIGSTYTFEVDAAGTIQPANGWIDINATAKLYGMKTGEASFSYRPPYNIAVGAEANFKEIFIAKFSAGINSSGVSGSAQGLLQIPGYVPIVGGYSLADAKASLYNTDFSGSVSITLTPAIPKVCTPSYCACVPYAYPCPTWSKPWRWCSGCSDVCVPEICTPAIPAVKASVGFKFSNGDFSFTTKQAAQPAWETAFNQPFYSEERDVRMQFMTNWTRLDKADRSGALRPFGFSPAGEPVTGFDLSASLPAAIFRITYANTEVTFVDASLTLPNGQSLPIDEGFLPQGFADAVGFSRFNPEAQEAYFFCHLPSAGHYVVTLGNAETLGEYSVELLGQNHAPRVEITSIEETSTPGQYQVNWVDEDHDDNAMVHFYLVNSRQDEQGFLLTSVAEDEQSNSLVLDTNQADIIPGHYYLMIVVDDGKNSRAIVYSASRLWVDNGNHPDPVTQIAVGAGNESFTIQWDYANPEKIKFFTILFSDEDFLTIHDDHVTVEKDIRSFTITGLENGRPLQVSVLAVDEDGLCSAPVTVLTVVPSPGFGYTPPVIVSKPDADATVGVVYFYLPRIFDADLRMGVFPDNNTDPSIDVEGLLYTWHLLEGPDGMVVDPDSGFITWTPEAAQVGSHNVVLLLTESIHDESGDAYPLEENVAIQEFSVMVLPEDNTNGVEHNPYIFYTTPPRFAYEKILYAYDVDLLVPQGVRVDYYIMDGPAGMTINADGHVQWDVPAGASSAMVSILAVIDGTHSLEQTYFLHVLTASNTLSFPSSVSTQPWQELR